MNDLKTSPIFTVYGMARFVVSLQVVYLSVSYDAQDAVFVFKPAGRQSERIETKGPTP